MDEGFLVAQVIHTGAEQTIAMPAAANMNDADAAIVIIEQVRAVTKTCARLDASIKRGFVTLYDQCSDQVRTKLEVTNGWGNTPNDQLL